MSKQQTTYTVMLLVFGFFYLMGGVETALIMRGVPAGDARINPVVLGDTVLAVSGLLAAAIAATLILRAAAPGAGRIATMALNIILLVFFPFGTIIGIYGIRKVDKGDKGRVEKETAGSG